MSNRIKEALIQIWNCKKEDKKELYISFFIVVISSIWYYAHYFLDFSIIISLTIYILLLLCSLILTTLTIYGILDITGLRRFIRSTLLVVPINWGIYISQEKSNFISNGILGIKKICLLILQTAFFTGIILLILNNLVLYPGISVKEILINIGYILKKDNYLFFFIFVVTGLLSISLTTWICVIKKIMNNIGNIFIIFLSTTIAYLTSLSYNPLSLAFSKDKLATEFLGKTLAGIIILIFLKFIYSLTLKGDEDFSLEGYWNDAIDYGRKNKTSSVGEYIEKVFEKEIEKNSIPYIFDNPIENNSDDELEIDEKAKQIYERIYKSKDLPDNYAINIGIEGSRGSGKTSLVNILKCDYLRKVPGSVIYFDFNVWRHSGNLTESFLRELKSFLVQKEIIDTKLSESMGKYIEKIGGIHPALSLINGMRGIFQKEQTTQDIYVEISEAIKKKGKKIVIFIDDVDRLSTWNKWNELFSILRASASFSNVFFIVCFSKKDLSKIYGKEYEIKDNILMQETDNYLEKIFSEEYNIDYSAESIANGNGEKVVQYYKKLSKNTIIDRIATDILNNANLEGEIEASIDKLFQEWKKDTTHYSQRTLEILENVSQRTIEEHFKQYLSDIYSDRLIVDLFSRLWNKKFLKKDIEYEKFKDRTPRYIKKIINTILEFFYRKGPERIANIFVDEIEKLTITPFKIGDEFGGGLVQEKDDDKFYLRLLDDKLVIELELFLREKRLLEAR